MRITPQLTIWNKYRRKGKSMPHPNASTLRSLPTKEKRDLLRREPHAIFNKCFENR